jgi:hypothetical protein
MKIYEIDCDGNAKMQLSIENEKITVLKAMNGHGIPILVNVLEIETK